MLAARAPRGYTAATGRHRIACAWPRRARRAALVHAAPRRAHARPAPRAARGACAKRAPRSPLSALARAASAPHPTLFCQLWPEYGLDLPPRGDARTYYTDSRGERHALPRGRDGAPRRGRRARLELDRAFPRELARAPVVLDIGFGDGASLLRAAGADGAGGGAPRRRARVLGVEAHAPALGVALLTLIPYPAVPIPVNSALGF